MSRPAISVSLLLMICTFVGTTFLIFFFIKPESAVSQTTPTVITLTSGTTWTVPSDWNSSSNTIEVIGGGGNGGNSGGGGGGGGAYSRISNLALSSGGSVSYVVGASASDSYFNGASCAGSSVCAKGGQTGPTTAVGGGAGGSAASGIGSVKFSGGTGGSMIAGYPPCAGGGGGGAAAGPSGNGAIGGNAPNCNTIGIGGASAGSPSGSGGNGGVTGWGGVSGAPTAGGSYGGGGGGAGISGTTTGAPGAPGIIVITYSPVVTPPCSSAPTPTNVRGWAWSDTIGWISLSSADQGTCTNEAYGLNIASNGTISGKMWSENIGWISADAADLAGCPTSPCTARMEGSAMKGWMKALAASQSEAAWDGWISLSGTSPAYGPTISINGTISGYAWGDTNLGWISFATAFSSATTTWVECTPSYSCTDETHAQNSCTGEITACTGGNICTGGAIACVIPPAPVPDGTAGNFKAKPQLIAPGKRTNLTWDIRYATTCSISEDNPNIADSWNTAEGDVMTSVISQQTVYTLTCTGPGTGAGGPLVQKATVYQTPSWKEI